MSIGNYGPAIINFDKVKGCAVSLNIGLPVHKESVISLIVEQGDSKFRRM